MNDYYYNYDPIVMETDLDRKKKFKKQRRLFSRVFLALFIYSLVSQVLATTVYIVAPWVLSAEHYEMFITSSAWEVVVSSVVQYVIAFPILLLVLIGTPKAEKKQKKKLSFSEFVFLFCIGEVLMFIGNYIGTTLNDVFASYSGSVPENNVATIISETPTWLIFLVVVILAPIVEELIFRKIMIDRLSIYGELVAIIFSALAFGLIHGNLYQFFYAALLGALLGFVYVKTRNVWYSVLMHMIVNFFGSIVAIPVEKAMNDFIEILAASEYGISFDLVALLVSAVILFTYISVQYGMLAGGVLVGIDYIKKKKFALSPEKEIYIPKGELIKRGILNVGTMCFLTLSTIIFLLSLIFS